MKTTSTCKWTQFDCPRAIKAFMALAVVIAARDASAAWWKGLNWSKSGSINNDYWEGFGIGYDDWYNGGHDSVTAETWANTEAVFEKGDGRFYVSLDSDFACRNVTIFGGATGGQMTMDLNGHEFSTVHDGWGFFFKGTDGDVVVSNGTLSVKKAINVGDDNGQGNTMTIVDATVAYPEAIAVGRGTSSGNAFVVDKGGLVIVSNTDGVHANWGMAVGENDGENGNSMIVRNGGVVTNTSPAMYVGRNTTGNSLHVENGGYLYRNSYTHLGNVSDTSVAPSDNSIVVDGEGSEIYIESHFMIGENVDTQFKNLGNKVVVSDGGLFHCKNDFQIRSSGNEVIVSNGTIRLDEGGLRLATDAGNGVTGNKLTVAGRSPWIRTSYDFKAVNGSTLRFVVPAGGYVAPDGFDEANESFGDNKSKDGGYTYVPVTAGVFLSIDSDTALEIDATEFARSIDKTTTIPLIRGCGYGNDSGITPEMIAAWNASLPDGCTVSMMGDIYTGWGQKTLMLTVKPLVGGFQVILR